MNLWEIPAEAVIYSWAKESMRSGSGPRLSTRHGTPGKHQHKVCKSFRGLAAIGWIIVSSGNQKQFSRIGNQGRRRDDLWAEESRKRVVARPARPASGSLDGFC